jgi:hypothetical protein
MKTTLKTTVVLALAALLGMQANVTLANGTSGHGHVGGHAKGASTSKGTHGKQGTQAAKKTANKGTPKTASKTHGARIGINVHVTPRGRLGAGRIVGGSWWGGFGTVVAADGTTETVPVVEERVVVPGNVETNASPEE